MKCQFSGDNSDNEYGHILIFENDVAEWLRDRWKW
jgi:hypothetical protein